MNGTTEQEHVLPCIYTRRSCQWSHSKHNGINQKPNQSTKSQNGEPWFRDGSKLMMSHIGMRVPKSRPNWKDITLFYQLLLKLFTNLAIKLFIYLFIFSPMPFIHTLSFPFFLFIIFSYLES